MREREDGRNGKGRVRKENIERKEGEKKEKNERMRIEEGEGG